MQTIKGVIVGPYGIGKTSLLRTLDPERTLAVDLEAGMLSVKDWQGQIFEVRDWPKARALASVIGGVDPASEPGKPYSKEYYEKAATALSIDRDSFDTVFIDSITVASRLCFKWVKQQPEAHDKQGVFSNLKAYGMLGQELMSWLIQLQHTADKNIWFVGLLDETKTDLGETQYSLQMEGSKAGNELPGIVDQVITMTEIKVRHEEKESKRRGLVCQKPNPWGYPSKDRSGVLNLVEPPHLGNLMEKVITSQRSTFNVNTNEFLEDEIVY